MMGWYRFDYFFIMKKFKYNRIERIEKSTHFGIYLNHLFDQDKIHTLYLVDTFDSL